MSLPLQVCQMKRCDFRLRLCELGNDWHGAAAIEFFQRVAEVAEAEGHHPDLALTNYRDVCITLSTHAVGGLTRPDIIMAAKLDAVPVDYSPKWLRENKPSA